MLRQLEARTGRRGGATVVVDRGMAFAENLAQIRARGHHYLVAARYPERGAHQDAFADAADWTEVVRVPSPRNPGQKKTRVVIKRQTVGDEVHILCRSDARGEKDRAIRDTHEQRFLADLRRFQTRVAQGRLRDPGKVQEAMGRLKERYPRVARYYAITYDAATGTVSWAEQTEKKAAASILDGTYLLKTDRQDLADDEIWRLYILLTRVEAAFRAMKSPLMERPIFHHLEHRVQTHIFLCVLAYHLLVAIEKRCLDSGWHTSWATLREHLSTHQVATVLLPALDGRILTIRRASTPDPIHRDIYRVLQIPSEVMKPVKAWTDSDATRA
jgi:transposase